MFCSKVCQPAECSGGGALRLCLAHCGPGPLRGCSTAPAQIPYHQHDMCSKQTWHHRLEGPFKQQMQAELPAFLLKPRAGTG